MKISLKELLVFPTLCESGFPISIVCCQKCLITFIFDLLSICPLNLFAPALWIHVIQSNLLSICSVNQNHLKAVCNYTGVYLFSKLSSVNRQAQQKGVSVNYRLRLFLLCCFLSSLVFEEDRSCTLLCHRSHASLHHSQPRFSRRPSGHGNRQPASPTHQLGDTNKVRLLFLSFFFTYFGESLSHIE